VCCLSKAKIKRLDLSGNYFPKDAAQFFSSSPHITQLALVHCSIGNEGARAVFRNKKFKMLDLGYNRISDAGVTHSSPDSALNEVTLCRNEIIICTRMSFK